MSNRFNRKIDINEKTMSMLEGLPVEVTEWYYNLAASMKSARTCQEYVRSIKRFLEFSGVELDNLSETIITKYMISIQTKRNKNGEAVPTSDSYKQTIWSVLNSFVTYLFKKDIIPVNYMKNVMRPKNKDEVKRYYLTEEDFQKILQCVRREGKRNSHKEYARAVVSRNLLIFILFMVTGMRRTALSDIDVGDIDFQKRTLTIVDKGEVEHVYYLDTSAMGYIEQWINDRNDILEGRKETALFITNKKERLSDSMIYDIVKEYTGKALGYQISPHKLRAGFCTILYDKTHDIKFVSKAVGHRDVSTTQIYIQTDNTDQIKAAKMMGGII